MSFEKSMKQINVKLLDFKRKNTDESQILLSEEITQILSKNEVEDDLQRLISIVLSRLLIEGKILAVVYLVDKNLKRMQTHDGILINQLKMKKDMFKYIKTNFLRMYHFENMETYTFLAKFLGSKIEQDELSINYLYEI